MSESIMLTSSVLACRVQVIQVTQVARLCTDGLDIQRIQTPDK